MIDLQEVQKVAKLARLTLSPGEETQFGAQLNDILGYVEQLKELDTTGVQPTTRAIELSNILREDRQTTYAQREALLGQAPEQDGDYFRVPKIMADAE